MQLLSLCPRMLDLPLRVRFESLAVCRSLALGVDLSEGFHIERPWQPLFVHFWYQKLSQLLFKNKLNELHGD